MADVQFRRINGRIVPIRGGAQSRGPEKKKLLRQGAGEVAGGLAVGAGTGVGVGRMHVHAQKLAHEAKNTYRVAKANYRAFAGAESSLLRDVAKNSRTLRHAVGQRWWAKQLHRGRNPLLFAGAGVAAGLIGHGVYKIRQAVGDHRKAKEVKGHYGKAIGVAAGVATFAAYERARGIKNPVEIAANVYARIKGVRRPFQKFGKGGPI